MTIGVTYPCESHLIISKIAEKALTQADASKEQIELATLVAELAAFFGFELKTAVPEKNLGSVPPWRKFPAAFSSRYDYVDSLIEASETSSFYSGIDLSSPIEIAKQKVALLADSYINYPKD